MRKRLISRRTFVRDAALAAAAVSVAPYYGCSGKASKFDPKGLPVRTLGKTGVRIPVYVVGCGSRWMAVEDDDKALEILDYALNKGLYHWDTAANYGNENISSEERIGKILKEKRDQVFLSSKVIERDADSARRTLETSLKRLQTDYIDLYQVHSIENMEDAEMLGQKGGVLEMLQSCKQEGLIRHTGFTGHADAAAMKKTALDYDFDTMLVALNHQTQGVQQFEELAVPAAAEKGMGVLAMKVIRPREFVEGIEPNQLIRYALSLEQVTAAVIGTDSIEVIDSNVELIKNFSPMPPEEMKELSQVLASFHHGPDVPWMQKGYTDGHFA
jgi:aryl-alcohol dehydrogenase-like predicted oxidoreductase